MRSTWKANRRHAGQQVTSKGEPIARPLQRKARYSLEELLVGSEVMTRLNVGVAFAQNGAPVGDELF